MRPKVNINTLHTKINAGEKITMLTCYDYPMALLEEKAGIDIVLVGDSMAMTVMGEETTLGMDLDTMVTHAKAVRKGSPSSFLVGDMPYMTYQISKKEAIRNASRFMAEAGCDAVKIEGGANMADTVEAMVKATIPVMGHLGLTPQSMAQLGGLKSQGRDCAGALRIIEDAKILEEAGISLLLLEAIPPEVGKIVAERANIPVIGIGAGPHVHGQLMIVHDMLGFFDAFTPKFVKKYVDLNSIILEALNGYKDDVVGQQYPDTCHHYNFINGEREKLLEKIENKQ
ncbi:3-methyl-2-oxobutanoate hydroxymethyltransferase [Dehalobacter sp. DCM]|uniref:3-methyl-2-oxobutanoate hydroxymethyltransferase n=1 Tax=Dehalobacter sp. DCM TaxID=2907827 RepID=UPI0030820484|nr:3-methyl-2-oxobutanoate hydroxymethyltransferase [Dehalobacter sp. DCM]